MIMSKQFITGVLAVISGAWAALALPEVSNVAMQQLTGTRTMQITYTLSEDAIITLGIETNGVALPDNVVTFLSGDVCKVVTNGTRTILWDAGADWDGNLDATVRPRVTAWPTNNPPDVVVFDVTAGSGATSYPVYYYTSLEALPYGGVQNFIYKCDRLVMKKIPRGSFTMGWLDIGVRHMTISKDFYIGIYEVTQGQWYRVRGTSPTGIVSDYQTRMVRPVTNVSYDHLRGSTGAGYDWPSTGSAVSDAVPFLSRLRDKTGFGTIDLPTDAQWEYACRAGTRTTFNSGDFAATAGGTVNEWLNPLGRYRYNGGWDGVTLPDYATCPPSQATHIVGSYAPNAWGLYDMHGNVREWCRDWHQTVMPPNDTDPTGPTTGSARVQRGGDWYYSAENCRSGYRGGVTPGTTSGSCGFRIMMNVE